VFLECLTITHSEINTIRLVNDTVDLQRSVEIFRRFPFQVSAATQSQDRPPAIDITADAVDQRLVLALRSLAGKREVANIRYEVVLSDTPEIVEFGPVDFSFDSVSGDSASRVSIRASFLKGALNDAFPSKQFAPSNAG
jgi:hypothetical protein